MFSDYVAFATTYGMKTLGVVLSAGLYIIIGIEVYAYFVVIAPVLKKRLGV